MAVYPVAGDPVASPQTQITFRGIPIRQLGQITVTGSSSGVHTGTLRTDSDGNGGSFLPTQPFTPGETVTVKTSQNIIGGANGTYQFTVAMPAGQIPGGAARPAKRVPGDVQQFVSEPGLQPPAIDVRTPPSDASGGDIFLGNQAGPVQYGPMIIGPGGGLVWFHPLPKNEIATDVRVQTYRGHPVLTWWQGAVSAAGTGNGEDVIYNTAYQQVATVRAGNGLSADLHEFAITPENTALITAYYPVITNATSVKGGSANQIVLDSVVQEIDIPTGLVLFQWDSLDQVPLSDSYAPIPTAGHPYDYFHVNSVQQGPAGNLIISSRNTWTVYAVNPQTGAILWQLSGKHSSFKMAPGTTFAFQHNVRLEPDGKITIFDDGAGPPAIEKLSRALTLQLNTANMTATLVSAYTHPGVLAFYEGSVEPLANGDQFVGWGQQPYFTEFNAQGQIDFDGRFVGANSSYRAYKMSWAATPATPPSIAVRTSGTNMDVYASWNGANQVSRWSVLTGSSPTDLRVAYTRYKQGFESKYEVARAAYAEVEALDAHGKVLGRTKPVHVS